ncbi:hypothetical protein EVJ58_g4275 [Rhodofomes roseus]|uniref:Uncharacterized protein n=1 Tax=Rhodofomes roseus TaxID=34475 RepID=A0A4Y9YHK3_9APHY|nr:hypothetical protein EVJ58_g4275 [Rhodofomes roseus]
MPTRAWLNSPNTFAGDDALAAALLVWVAVLLLDEVTLLLVATELLELDQVEVDVGDADEVDVLVDVVEGATHTDEVVVVEVDEPLSVPYHHSP